ncbi:MAG: hypothetical protein GX447_00715 [Elusimicrobia bacterium]|nr:hypothetical protein [Elusimicrobiota bacterium]
MAKMYPSGPVSFINSSEREFYNLLKDHSGTSDWVVFYSHRMVSARYLNEIDFLILIPELGVSLIELKANNPIRISPDTFVYDYKGKITEKENPFRKIKNLISQFKTILKLPGEELEKIFVSHILIFPEYKNFFDKKICFSSNTDNYINGLTDKKEIPDLIKELHKKQNENISRKDSVIDKKEISEILFKIEKILKSEFEIEENVLAAQFESEKTNSKKGLLSRWLMIENMKKAVLSGPAGSGKTFCCVQEMIKRSGEDFRIAYFCHSPLAETKLSREFSKVSNVEIFDLRSYLIKKLKKPANDTSRAEDLLKEINKNPPRPQYDFIAADDAEFYLSAHFLSFADKILKNGIKEGFLWIAADENYLTKEKAKIFNDALASFSLEGVKIKLNVNYRQGQTLSSLFSSFAGKNLYEDSEISISSKAEIRFYSQNQEIFLDLILENLTKTYKPSEIAFISVKQNEQSLAFRMKKENRGWGKKIASLSSPQDGFMRHGDIDSFCGLESKVAIITDIDEDFFKNDDAGLILYKAASKGLFKIIFLADEKVKDIFSGYMEGSV